MALLALCGAASGHTAAPKYIAHEFLELVGGAQRIAAGTISALDESWYELSIEASAWGEPEVRTLRIRRFKDWACASRWEPYALGQRVLVFARGSGSEWSAMGAGNEGELPISGGELVLRGFSDFDPAGAARAAGGPRYPLADAVAALRAFRQTIRWSRELDPKPAFGGPGGVWSARAGADELPHWSTRSTFAAQLWEAVLREPGAAPLRLSRARSLPASTRRISMPALPDARVRGPREGEAAFGCALAFAGRDRLAIAAALLPAAGALRGGVFVARDWARAPIEGEWIAAPLATAATVVPPPAFGTALAALPDLDADGRPEWIVGSRNGSLSTGSGLWLAWSGTRPPLELGASPVVRAALEPEQLFPNGTGLALAPTSGEQGETRVIFGAEHIVPKPNEACGLFELRLDARGEPMGCRRLALAAAVKATHLFTRSLVALGDLDGDGAAELACAAIADGPLDAQQRKSRGAVWILSPRPDAALHGLARITEAAGGFGALLANEAHFGLRLAAPGDVDGDGVPDLLALSEDALWVLFLRSNGELRAHVCIAGSMATDGPHFPTGLAACPASSKDERPLVAWAAERAVECGHGNRIVHVFQLGTDGSPLGW